MTFNEFRNQHLRKFGSLERVFVPPFHAGLHEEMTHFAGLIASQGPVAARQRLGTHFFNQSLFDPLKELYVTAAMFSGSRTLRQIQGRPQIELKAGFGTNPEWLQMIIDYLTRDNLSTVAGISDVTRSHILSVIEEGERQGLGPRQIAALLTSDELTAFRALRIVRTELAKAINFGQLLAQASSPFQSEKTWVAILDDRTRHTHELMNGVTVDASDLFYVPRLDGGVEEATGPGDPSLSAGNLINCRCTLIYRAKRNPQGRLLRK